MTTTRLGPVLLTGVILLRPARQGEIGDVFLGEGDRTSCHVLLEVGEGARARDGQGDRREGQEPGQRDLRNRGAMPGRDLGQASVVEVGVTAPYWAEGNE